MLPQSQNFGARDIFFRLANRYGVPCRYANDKECYGLLLLCSRWYSRECLNLFACHDLAPETYQCTLQRGRISLEAVAAVTVTVRAKILYLARQLICMHMRRKMTRVKYVWKLSVIQPLVKNRIYTMKQIKGAAYDQW